MKSDATALPAPESAPLSLGKVAVDISDLVKARLTFLVLVTTAAGYQLGASAVVGWMPLLHTLIGTGLVAAAAAALNQYLERDSDRLMRRTWDRPLAAGRLAADESVVLAISAAFIGVIYLGATVNLLAAALAGLTIWLYLAVYTPMKKRSEWNTLVGAIPGAIPPVIGWVAATGKCDAPAVALFAILFFWQMPHFMAIAWLYREDYGRAGFQMISLNDPTGFRTGREAVLHAVLLIPATLAPWWLGLCGLWYAVGAGLLGLWILGAALRFWRDPVRLKARKLFLVSILYLPALMLLLAWDKVGG
jgi:heme o synthase